MTFWMPVIFVCLNSGSCTVAYDDPYMTERDCEKALIGIVQALQTQRLAPTVATCIRADVKTA